MNENSQQKNGQSVCFEDLVISVNLISPRSVYGQIRDEIKNFIEERDIPDGSLLPDIRSLSVLADVSPRTVDRALTELIDEGVCFRRPKKGTYVGSATKVRPPREVYAVYCVKGWSDIDHDVVKLPMYRGIETACRENGTDCVFINSDIDNALVAYARSTELDLRGVIVLSHENLEQVERLAHLFPNIQFIYLNYQFPGFESTPANVYGIFNDEFAGGYQVGDFLARRGHTALSAITLDPMADENYLRRIRGYQEALKDHGLSDQAKRLLTLPPADKEQAKFAALAAPKALDFIPPPTAIFCVNDKLADGITSYLMKHDLADQVEVFGYDKTEVAFDYNVNFSTVSVDFTSMGRKAVDLLRSGKSPHHKVIRLTPELVVRTHKYDHTI